MSDNEYMFHRVGGVGADHEHIAAGELGRQASLLPNEADDDWTIVDDDRRLPVPANKVRISLLWKAMVFRDEAERAEYESGSGDLTLKRTMQILSDDLEQRGRGQLDIEAGYTSESNRRLIQQAFGPPRLNDVSRRKVESGNHSLVKPA